MTNPLPSSLHTYHDWIDNAVRFYPEWVLLSTSTCLKNPTRPEAQQDVWKSVGGLYLAVTKLRDIEKQLESVWPDTKEHIQNMKKLATKIDDHAGTIIAGLDTYSTAEQKAKNFKRMAALVTLYLHEVEPLRGYMKPLALPTGINRFPG